MKRQFLILMLVILFSICSIKNSICQQLAVSRISADSLVVNIDKYRNTKVEVEGLIIHVCSFNGKKLKLKTNNGEIIKIVPKDFLAHFDTSIYGKRIRVQGITQESRIEKSYIDKLEKEGILLCHIDNTPCKDSVWVHRQVVANRADSLSKRDIERLRRRMEKTNKDYISVVIIIAEELEIIE